ncbi:putative pentatricopeptide repeat-containing protein At1g12700, mitochondrial [Papaver somniferum]|uniref:putative pentatricopeptide repeat-containing protein At1g12700, mitochondrial n=1 Tax=Papaver somniferum TaxID=3469 RepID=UPI000E6F4EB1|nr:putative pentatricopeptide repeat-containing protein At1g12700, mitochondrial [Papaver somniferum]
MAQVFHLKQETDVDFSEAKLEAAVDKMCAGEKTKEHCNVESQQSEEQNNMKVDHGFCLLGEIIKRGHQPDVITLTTLIRWLCLQGKVDFAFKVFAQMTETGIQPNVFTCNTLVHGLSSTSELGLALQLKSKMPKWNCRPDVFSYCAIIDALCKGGLIDDALVLFSKMHRDLEVIPNVVVYSSLIGGLCNSGWLNEAKRLFDEMISRGISADVTAYTCIHGQQKEARRYFDEMIDQGILPDTITFIVRLVQVFGSPGIQLQGNPIPGIGFLRMRFLIQILLFG